MDHDIRELKDRMSREILSSFEKNEIGIASATIDITGLPAKPVSVDVKK